MNIKKVILVLGMLLVVSAFWNFEKENTYYLIPSVHAWVKAVDQDGNILFNDEVLDSDLFLQGFFISKGNFPINLTVRPHGDTISQEFIIERSFLKHTLLHIDSYHGEISLTEQRRIYQPMFQ